MALSLPDCLYCVRHESSDERVELFCFAFALLFHPFVVITGCLLHSSLFNVAPPVVDSHERMFKKVTTFQPLGSRVDTRPTVSGVRLQLTFSFRQSVVFLLFCTGSSTSGFSYDDTPSACVWNGKEPSDLRKLSLVLCRD